MNEAQQAVWRHVLRCLSAEVHDLWDIIGAPEEYTGHRVFLLAFKRGVVCGMKPELDFVPPYYSGEETRRAFQHGFKVGKKRLATREARVAVPHGE